MVQPRPGEMVITQGQEGQAMVKVWGVWLRGGRSVVEVGGVWLRQEECG